MAFVSLGTRTAIALSLVLAASGAATGVEFSNQTLAHLVEGKVTAAGMIVDLFAASVTPALDFDDEEALTQEFGKLAKNKDVVYAALFRPGTALPVAETGDATMRPTAAPTSATTRTSATDITVEQVLTNADHRHLGSLVVRVSLAPENARFLSARTRIIQFTVILTLLAGALVIVIARRVITKPLRSLAYAANRLEKGSAELVEARGTDEIAQLGRAFNAMSSAIIDRERRLAELNHELMRLLDSMRQAIVVFGEGGLLAAVKSHQAEVIFGMKDVEGFRVQELLFPDEYGVGRTAFNEWLTVAFSVPPSKWPDVAELAPAEVVLERSGKERVLALDFRPVEAGGRIVKIMMLASDETEKRTLERTVRERDEEHEKQMAAMRRLVAGGGQLLVSVLGRARERMLSCQKLVALSKEELEPAFVEQLFGHIHSVKGEARAFDLSLLEASAGELEDFLAILRGRLREGQKLTVESVRDDLEQRIDATQEAVDGAATMLVEASPIGTAILEQVTVQRGDVERLLELAGNRPDDVGRLVNRLASRPFGEMLLGLAEAVPRWAIREGKRARVDVEGKEVVIPPRLAALLPDVMTHLVRNALAHGIETTSDRVAAGKDEVGLIRVSASDFAEGPVISIEDDGRGLDEAALKARGADLGLREVDATRLAFVRGLSTATTKGRGASSTASGGGSELAGHGVGLGAVRTDLATVDYEIALQATGTGLRVELLPKPHAARATPAGKVQQGPA